MARSKVGSRQRSGSRHRTAAESTDVHPDRHGRPCRPAAREPSISASTSSFRETRTCSPSPLTTSWSRPSSQTTRAPMPATATRLRRSPRASPHWLPSSPGQLGDRQPPPPDSSSRTAASSSPLRGTHVRSAGAARNDRLGVLGLVSGIVGADRERQGDRVGREPAPAGRVEAIQTQLRDVDHVGSAS